MTDIRDGVVPPHGTDMSETERKAWWRGYYLGLREASETWVVVVEEETINEQLRNRIYEQVQRELGESGFRSVAAEG